MRKQTLLGAAVVLAATGSAHAQMIGSYDNFDCFNDTGETAEGFEIDVEDVKPTDVTRIFPDNFPAGQPYIRWSTPARAALQPVTFPDGHTGVSIVYAARYVAGQWLAAWGSATMPGSSVPLGNGTPYVAQPTYTTGDSCWTYGLGAQYPTSGCDHFGLSLAAGVVPGRMTMHWLVPDPNHPGSLIQNGTVASLPPGPVLTPGAAGAPPQVQAAAEGPEQPEHEAEAQCSDAYWVRTYTSFSPKRPNLNLLQKGKVPMRGPKVSVAWHLVQHCPPPSEAERAEVERNRLPAGAAQVVKRFEYFAYDGAYDDDHAAVCGGDGDCTKPGLGVNGQNELGRFLGAHNMAYGVK